MSQFEKSICERNLKLHMVPVSLSLHQLFLPSLQRKCSVAWAWWRDDRSSQTLTTCITLIASKLHSNFQLWDATRDELRRERESATEPAAEDDSNVYWVFFLTLWHVTFNKALSQYVTGYRYSFNSSFILSCLEWFKGIKMKLPNEEK